MLKKIVQFSSKSLFMPIQYVLMGLFLLSLQSKITAQSYIGFTSENYAGIHGVLVNPAMVADSPYKVDVNLGSASVFGGSDVLGFDLIKLVSDDTYNLRRDAEYAPKEENAIYGNIDILGPSVLFNLGPKHSIGITTRVRGFANMNRVNGELFQNAWNKFNDSENFTVDDGDFNVTVHAWTETGITLGGIIADQGKHFIKGGITLKYLRGLGAGTVDGLDITGSYRNDDAGVNTLTSTGEITYVLSKGYYIEEEPDFSKAPWTVGADIGFVYEWRPQHQRYFFDDSDGNKVAMRDKNKYRFRAGISITDIGGTLGYNNSTLRNYNMNNTIDANQLNRGGIENRLDEFYLDTDVQTNDLKISSPTAAHINLDWHLKKRYYLNVNTDLSLRNAEKIHTNRKMNNFSITPRYERKWLSIYTPMSFRQQGDFALGMGFRAGPLFVGSGSIFSNLMNKASKTTDIYFGLKIPLYHKSTGPIGDYDDKEDTDRDGIPNNKDNCPEIPGLPEDNGCPDGLDSDGDTIPDADDECPDAAGSVKLKGCPDADNDGVPDIDDVCPELAGTSERDGCPSDIDRAVQTINNFANVILFKYGKSSFEEASFYTLNSIVDILKEYPKATFVIEGHTDNSGSFETNKKLSIDRAEAVRDYFVANGVDIQRFKTVGFGEMKPLSTNETEEGRAINRRVVVKLLSVD